jgi:dimeric dUTPase (all-alpha-NTP-PPase superfamily)
MKIVIRDELAYERWSFSSWTRSGKADREEELEETSEDILFFLLSSKLFFENACISQNTT